MVTITCYKTTGRAIHVETGYPPFEISIGGFYAKTDGNIFFVVENRGSKRFSNGQGVPVTEIRVKDGDGGTPESFSNASALMSRLRELNYPAFEYENGGGGGGSSETNLSYNPATGEVSNDNGDGFTIPEVSSVNPGLATPDMLEAANALKGRIVQYGNWITAGFTSAWENYKVLFGNTVVDVVDDSVAYSPSAAGYTRYDRVEVDSDGIVSLVTGVESTGFPDKPAATAGKVTIGFLQITDSTEYWIPVSEGFVTKESQQFQAVFGTGAVTLPVTENFNYMLREGITQVDGIESLLVSSPELNRFGQEMKIINGASGDVVLKNGILYFQSGTDFTLPAEHVASFSYHPDGAWIFTGSSVQGGGGGIASIGSQDGVDIDDTDPDNPVIGLGDITPTSVATATITGISEDYSDGFFKTGGGMTQMGDIADEYNGTILEVSVDDNHINMKSSEINIDGDVDVTGNLKATTYGTDEVTDTELGYLDGATSNIQTQLNEKQATLVSGTNIKTVGGQSLLGSGDVTEVQNSMTASTLLAPSVTAVNTELATRIKGNVRVQAAALATMSSSTTYYIGGSNNIVPTTTSRYKMLFPVNATSFRANIFLYTNGTNYGSGENIQVVLHDVTTNTSHTIGNVSITGYSQGLLATVSATITAGNEFEIRLITPSFSTPPQQVVFGGDIDFF